MAAAAFHEAVAAAAGVAAQHADDVDARARFPREAIDALRDGGTLGASVGTAHGGPDVGFADICDACRVLSRGCAATGMIFAMHHIQVASIARHAGDSAYIRDYLGRVASEQRLVASATSEVGTGGDLRRSIACVEDRGGGRLGFTKNAPTVSYGGHADDVLTTVWRGPDADASDQVLVLTARDESGMTQTGEWDTMGMRGTCSPGFEISAVFGPEQIVPGEFAPICSETMVPWSHLTWAHVWLGIATSAVGRAQAMVRAQCRRSPDVTPEAGGRLSAVVARLQAMRAFVDAATAEYAALMDGDPAHLSSFGYGLRINNLKIRASEDVAAICHDALGVVGIAGYRNGTPFSLGRHVRDSLSAALMIGNERIHATNARILLVQREV